MSIGMVGGMLFLTSVIAISVLSFYYDRARPEKRREQYPDRHIYYPLAHGQFGLFQAYFVLCDVIVFAMAFFCLGGLLFEKEGQAIAIAGSVLLSGTGVLLLKWGIPRLSTGKVQCVIVDAGGLTILYRIGIQESYTVQEYKERLVPNGDPKFPMCFQKQDMREVKLRLKYLGEEDIYSIAMDLRALQQTGKLPVAEGEADAAVPNRTGQPQVTQSTQDTVVTAAVEQKNASESVAVNPQKEQTDEERYLAMVKQARRLMEIGKSLSTAQKQEIRSIIESGRHLQAVTRCRDLAGCNIREAKELVDDHRRYLPDNEWIEEVTQDEDARCYAVYLRQEAAKLSIAQRLELIRMYRHDLAVAAVDTCREWTGLAPMDAHRIVHEYHICLLQDAAIDAGIPFATPYPQGDLPEYIAKVRRMNNAAPIIPGYKSAVLPADSAIGCRKDKKAEVDTGCTE